MAITAEGASKYFKGTTLSAKWAEYSTEQKESAVEMATREFSRALGRPLREDEPEYQMGDATREEFAAYEQALYTLLRDAQPTGGTGSMVPSLDQEDQRSPAFTLAGSAGQWSPRALSWLGRLGVVARNGS